MSGLRLLAGHFYRLAAGSGTKTLNKCFYSSMTRNITPRITSVRHYSAYDEEGKTVAFVINKKTSDVFCVDSIRTDGFLLADGNELLGSVIIFPHSALGWNIHTLKEINEDSLILFKVLEPKLDILIIGYGDVKDYTQEDRVRITQACKSLGIKFEILPTQQACGIYNFLASELRYVAGAFIPPPQIFKHKLKDVKLSASESKDDDDEDEDLLESGESSKEQKLIK